MAWTLSFELFFYLLLGIALGVRHPRRRWVLIAAPSLLALLQSLFTGSVAFTQASSPLSLLASPYQWEFLLGCGVAVLTGYRWPWLVALRRQRPLLAALGLLAGVLLFWPFSDTLLPRLLHLLVLATLILLSSVRDFQVPGLRPLAGVGVISYSLYLIHNPLQSLVVRLALRLQQPEAVAAALLALIPLLAAVVYFRTFESWSLHVMQRAASGLQST